MSGNRYVQVPKPIQCGKLVLSFFELVKHLVESDDRFNRTMQGGRAGSRVLDAFEKAPVGQVVQLHPDDLRLLREAVEAPSAGYPQITLGKMLPNGEQVVTGTINIPAYQLTDMADCLSEERTAEPPPKNPSPRGDEIADAKN